MIEKLCYKLIHERLDFISGVDIMKCIINYVYGLFVMLLGVTIINYERFKNWINRSFILYYNSKKPS